MAKAELGAKRRCLSCGALFFDFNREQIVCPKCSAVFQVVDLPHSEPRKAFYRPVASDGPLNDDQTAADDVETVEADGETETESDDSVLESEEDEQEEDGIEEIDDLM